MPKYQSDDLPIILRLAASSFIFASKLKIWKRYLQIGAHAFLSGGIGTLLHRRPYQDFLDKDAVILVTGASRGLGARYVEKLATQCKGKVVLVARNAQAMEQLVKEIQEKHAGEELAKLIIIPHDLGEATENDPQSKKVKILEEAMPAVIDSLMASAQTMGVLDAESNERWHKNKPALIDAAINYLHSAGLLVEEEETHVGGKALAEKLRKRGLIPTVIINNAGISANKPFTETTERERRLTNEVNFNQPLELFHTLLPDMRDLGRRTKVIFVSSMAAYTGFPGNSAYGASRTAMRGFIRSVKPELKKGDPEIYMIPFGQILTEASADYQRWYMPAVTVEEAAIDLLTLTAAQNAPTINTPGTINKFTAWFDRSVSQLPADLIAASITGILGPKKNK